MRFRFLLAFKCPLSHHEQYGDIIGNNSGVQHGGPTKIVARREWVEWHKARTRQGSRAKIAPECLINISHIIALKRRSQRAVGRRGGNEEERKTGAELQGIIHWR